MTAPGTSLRPKFCPDCGNAIDALAATCPHCGLTQPSYFGKSDKKVMPAFILALLFGVFGAHRFYVGKTGTGILQLLTLGGLGIWALIDVVLIVTESFKDGEGRAITQWT